MENELVPLNAADPWDEVFSDLPDLNEFDEFKKIELAAQLSALLAFSEFTRSEAADSLGWKRSRITNVLSGNSNPTLKTVYEFCKAIGFEVDLSFRKLSEGRAEQPWEKSRLSAMVGTFQTALEVHADFLKGTPKPMYFSLNYSSLEHPLKNMGYVEEVVPIQGSRFKPYVISSVPDAALAT